MCSKRHKFAPGSERPLYFGPALSRSIYTTLVEVNTKLMKKGYERVDLAHLKKGIHRGGSRISGKGVHMHKGVGVRFADFISFSLNIP